MNSNLDLFIKKASPRDHCGFTERPIQTIETDIRTLLLQSDVGIKYQSYSVRSSAYIRSYTHKKKRKDAAMNVIPQHPKKVVLRSFLLFGCPATIWLQTSNELRAGELTVVTPCKDMEIQIGL